MNETATPAPVPMEPDSQPPPTPPTSKTVQVGPGEGMVNTLGEAFAQAEGGDTIEICQDEPLEVDGSKTNWTKPGGLTIRNGEGFRPVLVPSNPASKRIITIRKSEIDNQKLQLLGLTFVDLVSDRTGIMVYAEPGAVANRCLFISRRAYSISGGSTAMGGIELRDCYLWRPWHPVASATIHFAGELQLSNCLLAGDGSLGLREENRTSVSSSSFVGTRNAFTVTGTTLLNSERNLFVNLKSVVSFWTLQHGDIKTAKCLLPSYSGQSNLYFNCERFALDLAPKAAADLAVWQQFTGNSEKAQVLADPQFARPDLVAQSRQRLLPPSAFRLRPTSPARRRNIGCDVSKLPDLPPALIDLLPPDMRPPE